MKKFAILTATVSMSALAAAPANAATFLFSLTGPDTAAFTLESPSVPDSSSTIIFNQIGFDDVPITLNGMDEIASSIRFNRGFGGALVINGTSLGGATFTGPPLFNRIGDGRIEFVQGDFTLSRALGGPGAYQLSITEVGAVPEPGTWALMLLGFGFAGAALRRRKKQRVTVSYA